MEIVALSFHYSRIQPLGPQPKDSDTRHWCRKASQWRKALGDKHVQHSLTC
jgi:hypothetical protein